MGGAPWQPVLGASEVCRATNKVSMDDAAVVVAPDNLMSSDAACC